MVNFHFNKRNTKDLIIASKDIPKITKLRFDWLLDNNKFCGYIKDSFWGRRVFMIQKYKNDYRLICTLKENTFIYLIEDIENFLSFVPCDEIIFPESQDIIDSLNVLKDFPSTGIVSIQDNKIYLFDFGESY